MTNDANKKIYLVGDPIVNSGLTAIRLLINKDMSECSEENLKHLSDGLVDLYLTPAWQKELQSIFPNSTYIQSAKNYDKKSKSKEFLYELVEGMIRSKDTTKVCVLCGGPAHRRKDGKPFTKTHIPLVGSSDFTNFFPSLKNGMDICARCALAVQFAPLLFYKSGGKPTCISCTNENVMTLFGKDCIEYINKQKVLNAFGSKDVSGTFDEGYKSPFNALFHLAYKVSIKNERLGLLKENEEITIYVIDNYNQNPRGIDIYKLPNNIFKFVIIVMKSHEYKKAWYHLLFKHYVKSSDTKLDIQVTKTNPNRIHEALIRNESILRYFRDDKYKNSIVPWAIVECYAALVRKMNKQRIETIKKLADNIATCIRESGNKKRVNDIVSARDVVTFRNQLRWVFRDWQKLGKPAPMVTYDEYVSSIMEGNPSSWSETRDLIAIRLYEKLHDMLVGTESQEEGADSYITEIEAELSEADEK